MSHFESDPNVMSEKVSIKCLNERSVVSKIDDILLYPRILTGTFSSV